METKTIKSQNMIYGSQFTPLRHIVGAFIENRLEPVLKVLEKSIINEEDAIEILGVKNGTFFFEIQEKLKPTFGPSGSTLRWYNLSEILALLKD